MSDDARGAMLREDRAEWDRLTAVLDAYPEEGLHDPASSPWTSRDVDAHLARWMERSMDQLRARLEGREAPRLEGTDDETNARWQQEDSRLSVDGELHRRGGPQHSPTAWDYHPGQKYAPPAPEERGLCFVHPFGRSGRMTAPGSAL